MTPPTFEPRKYKLSNGLTVILDVNRAAPVLSLYLGVRVGSAMEMPREAGLSHLLEHMVFKGTKSYGPGEIASIVEKSGGELNAYTSFDQTVYYINLASSFLKEGLDLLKEMAFDALIDSVELVREKEVVLEEMRRSKDNPHHMLSEELFSKSFKVHPYGRPVIGNENIIREVTPEEVKDYYKRWYCPNNMVLTLCGDFNIEQAEKTISNLFSPLEAKSLPFVSIPSEPPPQAPTLSVIKSEVQGIYWTLAFPIPSMTHQDIPAIDLLSHLLGGTDTSRLEQVIKEKKGLVTAIHSAAYTPLHPGLFIVEAMIPEKKVKKAIEAIYEEIKHCTQNLFPHEDLTRGKLNFKSSLFYEKETCEGTARKRVVYELLAGDMAFEDAYLKQIESVSEHDILAVAKKYLSFQSSTSVLLHPQTQKHSIPKLPSSKKATVSPKKNAFIEEWKGIKKYQLSNGLTIITRENTRLPLLSAKFVSPGGLRFENDRNNGITQLVTSMLEKGAGGLSGPQIAKAMENMAGHMGGFVGRNSWGVSASFISEKLHEGLDLFSKLILSPTFDEKEFIKEKKLTLEAIKNQEDSLSTLAFKQFQELLYHKHPYRLPLIGSKKTVGGITRNQVQRYYSQILNSKNSVLALAGDFDSDRIITHLEILFSKMRGKSIPFRNPKPDKPPIKIKKGQITKKKMQAHLILGFMANTLFDEDRYAFEVLNSLLSGQGGRLFIELRDKEAMAYTVSSSLVMGLDTGFFSVYIGTEPSKKDMAIGGILRELSRVKKDLISEEELLRAKNFLVGNHAIDLQKNSHVASVIAFNEAYGYGLAEFEDYSRKILHVTAQDVLEVANKYLNLDAYVLSVVIP